jgi:hypothetical protein
MRAEYLRVAERRSNGDVFLERDLALHFVFPVTFPASCNAAAAAVSNAVLCRA